MDLSEAIGIGAGVFTAVSMIPQLVKMTREKKAGDVSVTMFIVLVAGLLMWVWYGALKKDWPIIMTNAFSFGQRSEYFLYPEIQKTKSR